MNAWSALGFNWRDLQALNERHPVREFAFQKRPNEVSVRFPWPALLCRQRLAPRFFDLRPSRLESGRNLSASRSAQSPFPLGRSFCGLGLDPTHRSRNLSTQRGL